MKKIAVTGMDFATLSNNKLLNFIPAWLLILAAMKTRRMPVMVNSTYLITTVIFLCN